MELNITPEKPKGVKSPKTDTKQVNLKNVKFQVIQDKDSTLDSDDFAMVARHTPDP